jgi:hypothetical protein
MIGLLKFLFLDKRARRSLAPAPVKAARAAAPKTAAPPQRERTPAEALAEAEERMRRLPPEKAQLVRSAMAVHRVRQSVLADLSDEDRRRLQDMAEKAFFGGGKSR